MIVNDVRRIFKNDFEPSINQMEHMLIIRILLSEGDAIDLIT